LYKCERPLTLAMNYAEYPAGLMLAPFVKKLWALDNLASAEASGERSVLPNGCFTLVFIEGGAVKAATRLERQTLFPGSYFVGQLTEAIRIDFSSHTRAVMVQLFPWAPAYFSRAGMGPFTDRIIAANIPLAVLAEQAVKLAVFRAFRDCLEAGSRQELLRSACSALQEPGRDDGIAGLSLELGCSPRYLQALFRKHVGLSPKQFANILRLRGAVDDMDYSRFYDQAHFIRAFRGVTGISPSKFDASQYFLAYRE
jgi:AraC-like DNA-binding protein